MELLNDLNDSQREAVINFEGPSLILSGAGSGKTRVLTYRIAYMIHNGIKPWNILALTFTNKAAKEMVGRIEGLIGFQAKNIWAGTFHSIFARILRIEGQKLGFDRNYNIYDTGDSKSLLKSIMDQEDDPTIKKLKPDAVRWEISMAKNRLISPLEYEKNILGLFSQNVSHLYTIYQERLMQSNAMDFDDLISHPVRLFENFPEVLSFYRKKFSYILVDEYQDTNFSQYRLINLIGKEHRNVAVIGDDDQSIYSFRGADITNILNFERDYPETKIYRLEQNYRSTKTILKAAGDVVKNNFLRRDKDIWTENDAGEKITLLVGANEREEAANVLSLINKSLTEKNCKLNHIAVLYRTNAQSRVLEEALRTGGLPYRVIGGLKFYERKEIKDILAYLKILLNPRDTQSFKRIVNFPPRRIGKASVEAIERYSAENNLPILNACENPGEIDGLTLRAHHPVKKFYIDIRDISMTLSEISLVELTDKLIDKFGLIDVYKEENTPESKSRIDNIDELLNGIKEFVALRDDNSPAAFLEEVSLITDIDRSDESSDAVTLMTVHSAKGLEFPTVFITGLEDGLFPIVMPNEGSEEKRIEEERRLFYVALTRAKVKLYLSHALERRRFSYDNAFTTISRFIGEISDDLFEKFISPSCSEYYEETGYLHKKIENKLHSSVNKEKIKDISSKRNSNMTAISVGATVRHNVFGVGMVIDASGDGEGRKLTIKFNKAVGIRKLVECFAGLDVL